MGEEKLSKKQQKALSFRKSKEERTQEKSEKQQQKAEKSLKRKLEEEEGEPTTEKKEKKEKKDKKEKKEKKEKSDKSVKTEKTETEDGSEPPKKKRKTRRGKKGKGTNGGTGPRFILFVGNLPYDTQEAELETHFKNAKPDRFRIRRDKGIAFLEFDNDTPAIQSKMDHALGMHHLVFRKRKINVELTAGGGGNSEARTQKLKEKNDKLVEERREKVKKELTKRSVKEKESAVANGGMHPARAAMLNQS